MSEHSEVSHKEATERIKRSWAMKPNTQEYLELRAKALELLNQRRMKTAYSKTVLA